MDPAPAGLEIQVIRSPEVPPASDIQEPPGGQRDQSRRDDGQRPADAIEPLIAVGNEVERDARVQEAGIVEALALPLLADERDRD